MTVNNSIGTDGEDKSMSNPLLDILKALAHPIRLEIIQQLLADEPEAERHCTSFGLSISKATRSHHFKLLKEAGLIDHVDRGNHSLARLRHAYLNEHFPGLLELLRSSSVNESFPKP